MRVIAATNAAPAAAGLDSMSEMGETESLRFQILTDRMSKADSANSNLLERAADAGGARAQGFMDYTDDSCMHQAMAIFYNGHAGLGAHLLCSPDFASSKNEVSIESSRCLPEIDDEVLVAFEDGGPRRPFVVGSLWNAGSTPAGVIESVGTKYTMFLPDGAA